MVSEKSLIKDIKGGIKDGIQSRDYMKGFMFACYLLHGITAKTLDELKICLKEKYNNEEGK